MTRVSSYKLMVSEFAYAINVVDRRQNAMAKLTVHETTNRPVNGFLLI
jgi:hypothetical protein